VDEVARVVVRHKESSRTKVDICSVDFSFVSFAICFHRWLFAWEKARCRSERRDMCIIDSISGVYLNLFKSALMNNKSPIWHEMNRGTRKRENM
jgi:hypothetical protein